jgi:hypothetical protein
MSRTKGSGWGGGPLLYQIHEKCGKKKAYYDPFPHIGHDFKCTYCKERFYSNKLIKSTHPKSITIEEAKKRVQGWIDNETQVIITGSYLFHDDPTTIREFLPDNYFVYVFGSPDIYEITRIKEYKK